MKIEFDEFVNIRMGEALEDELRKSADFCQTEKEMMTARKKVNDVLEMTEESRSACDDLENVLLKYNALYGEMAYRMGYSDGRLVGVEQAPDGRKSVLSVEDMTKLISLYDAVKQLNIALFGGLESHRGGNGALGAFEYVYDIIENAVCAEIKLLGEDESAERITFILDHDKETPEERAKKLLGLK